MRSRARGYWRWPCAIRRLPALPQEMPPATPMTFQAGNVLIAKAGGEDLSNASGVRASVKAGLGVDRVVHGLETAVRQVAPCRGTDMGWTISRAEHDQRPESNSESSWLMPMRRSGAEQTPSRLTNGGERSPAALWGRSKRGVCGAMPRYPPNQTRAAPVVQALALRRLTALAWSG